MRSTDVAAAPRSGFILPTTLLVMTLLTVMLTAAFIMASAEFRASDNSLSNSRALSLAQAGLENYFSSQRLLDTLSTYDSVRITFSNGYADVVGWRVRKQTGNHLPLWLVRSIGTSTDATAAHVPQGQRAVAQMAELNAGLIPARAAITAINGIQMVQGTGTQNPISGHDNNYGSSVPNCTKPGGTAGDTAAYTIGGLAPFFGPGTIAAAAGANTYTKSGGGGNFNSAGFHQGDTIVAYGFTNAANNGYAIITAFSNNVLTVSRALVNEGAAANRYISEARGNYLAGTATSPVGTQQVFSLGAAYDSSHVDWQRVLNGDFSPDYVGTLPTVGNSTYYSYYWNAPLVTVPTGQQRGLLIATGDVRLNSGAHWDGIIIAGGRLLATGTPASYSFTLHGMAITGLNCGTSGGCPVTQDSVMTTNNVTPTFVWDWCYTHAAIGGLNGLVPIKNTWVDTWSLY